MHTDKIIIKSLVITVITLGFIACGGGSSNTSEEKVWNENFEKFNIHVDKLSNSATYPEGEASTASNEDWIISKKKNTSFYISEEVSMEKLLSYAEADTFCNDLSIDTQALNWRLPTNNELLVIGELHPIDTFFWSSDITDIVFSKTHDSVDLKEQFICKAQFFYDLKTKEGVWQQYCNDKLSGKYAICVANTTN